MVRFKCFTGSEITNSLIDMKSLLLALKGMFLNIIFD